MTVFIQFFTVLKPLSLKKKKKQKQKKTKTKKNKQKKAKKEVNKISSKDMVSKADLPNSLPVPSPVVTLQ